MIRRSLSAGLRVPASPRYVRGSRPNELWAHFGNGAVVRVEQTRVRHYPRLEGPAPETRSLYSKVVELRPAAEHVLDLGCGSGVGARALISEGYRVTGIDSDRIALAFAKQYEPRGDYVFADLCSEPGLPRASAAISVDVLGHVSDVRAPLANVRKQLEAPAWMLVAEPIASPSQELVPPVRRAFSQASLRALLGQSGFEVARWLPGGDFSVALAIRLPGEEWGRLQNAAQLLRRKEFEAALVVLLPLTKSGAGTVAFEATLLEAGARVRLGDYSRVAAALARATELSPLDPRPDVGRAHLALSAGRPGAALDAIHSALGKDPSEPSAARAAALLAEDYSHDADRLKAWQLFNNLCPANQEAAFRVAALLSASGNASRSETVLARYHSYSENRRVAS